jgi:hypothetical protein
VTRVLTLALILPEIKDGETDDVRNYSSDLLHKTISSTPSLTSKMSDTFMGGGHILQHASSTTGQEAVPRKASRSSYSEEKGTRDTEKGVVDPLTYNNRVEEEFAESQAGRRTVFWNQYRPIILASVAAVILGWWISSTILKATRHRW